MTPFIGTIINVTSTKINGSTTKNKQVNKNRFQQEKKKTKKRLFSVIHIVREEKQSAHIGCVALLNI